jgi:hypothetical protein
MERAVSCFSVVYFFYQSFYVVCFLRVCMVVGLVLSNYAGYMSKKPQSNIIVVFCNMTLRLHVDTAS